MSSSPYSEKSKSSLASVSVSEEVASTSHSTGTSTPHHEGYGNNWVWGVILFIVLVIVLLIIFAAWQPRWLLRSRKGKKSHGKDDSSHDDHDLCVDWVRALLAAIIVAIVLIILYLLLRGIVNSWACYY